jgi:hypothetical protein
MLLFLLYLRTRRYLQKELVISAIFPTGLENYSLDRELNESRASGCSTCCFLRIVNA